MSIGSIGAAGGIAGSQMASARSVDTVSKSIQNEISSVQQKMQKLSSKEDMSVEEKMKKRQELQQEISSLNTQLRQHQSEASRKQRQEEISRRQQQEEAASKRRQEEVSDKQQQAEAAGKRRQEEVGKEQHQEVSKKESRIQVEGGPENAEKMESLPPKGMHAAAAAESAMEQAAKQGTVVARIEGGIAVLKGEIRQDEARGENVEYKQEELAKQEERAYRASSSQFSTLGEAHRTLREAAQDVTEKPEGQGRVGLRRSHDIDDKGMIGATNYKKDTRENAQVQQQTLFPAMDVRG